MQRPLAWYETSGSTLHEARLPFASFFMIDPSENPTVRPGPSRVSEGPVDRVDGEEGLIIIGRRRAPVV